MFSSEFRCSPSLWMMKDDRIGLALAVGTCAVVAALWSRARKRARILLVCDLNGVLCARFQGLGGTALQTVLRPHTKSFLAFAFEHFDIAMMTAQHRPRLVSELEQVCTAEQRRRIAFAWDGSHHAIMRHVLSPTGPAITSKNKSGKPWFLKRLADISVATGRPAERILILDDAGEKLFGNPYGSGLVTPRFKRADKHDDRSGPLPELETVAIARQMSESDPQDDFLAPDGAFTRALSELSAAASVDARLNVHLWTAAHPFLQTLCHDDATMVLEPASIALCSGERTADEAAELDGLIIADHAYKVQHHLTSGPATTSFLPEPESSCTVSRLARYDATCARASFSAISTAEPRSVSSSLSRCGSRTRARCRGCGPVSGRCCRRSPRESKSSRASSGRCSSGESWTAHARPSFRSAHTFATWSMPHCRCDPDMKRSVAQ